jgi:hypothetical protein
MGAGAELLILPIGAMAFFSSVAFFAAFFNRTVARVSAGVAIVIVALFLLLILQMNRWNFGWLFYLLTESSFPFVVLYGSVLLSLVAVLAPLRHAHKALPDGSQTPGGPRWVLFAIACCGATLLVGYGVAQLVEGSRGEQKTIPLLSGQPNIRLKQIQIDYQQRRLICNDPEVLRYLEERFRTFDPNRRELGTTYRLSLSYEDGGTQSFSTYWSDSGDFSLFVGDPGDGGKCHGILLTHPRPRAVDELISFLLKDHQDIAGTILILEAGGSRVERDDCLVVK